MLGYSVDALVCDNHKKINSWVSFPSYMSMLPLSADPGLAPELRYRQYILTSSRLTQTAVYVNLNKEQLI